MSEPRALALSAASGLFWLTGAVLVLALVLGGGTGPGLLSDSVVQLASLPLAAVAFQRYRSEPGLPPLRGILLFAVAIVLLPAAQLIPLPPNVWTALPGREAIAAAFLAADLAMPWMPLSLSPESTWLSLLSLLPALAVFFAVVLLGRRERRNLTVLLIIFGVANVVLGLAQLMQGPESPLRFFAITNPTEAVGVFANRNHYAALLYALMPLTAAFAVSLAANFERGRGGAGHNSRRIAGLAACLVVFATLVLGVGMARSRSGLALAMVAGSGSLALAWPYRNSNLGRRSAKLLFVATAVGALLVVQAGLYRILQRLDAGVIDEIRYNIASTTLQAIKAHMPFGTGMGTFVPVYQMFETPAVALDTYMNRAHNDFLELLLEAGAAAAVLMVIFAAWFVVRSVAVWRQQPSVGDGFEACDLSIARAGSVIVVTLMLHSIVDYPLRTSAVMAVFAFACAILTEPAAVKLPAEQRRRRPEDAHGTESRDRANESGAWA